MVKKRGDLPNGLPPDELSGGGDLEPRPAGLDRATELKLIDVALQDNIQAFSELFEHYRPHLHTLCLQRLNDFALAEDVVQEVFIKAFKSLPNSDYRKPIWPWLATIAIRMCVDLQRRRSFTHYSADIGVSVDTEANRSVFGGRTGSVLGEVIASEDRAKLWRSVDVLPERQRRALLLYALDGMSYEDIAAAEGITVGAVKLLLVRARRKIRKVTKSGSLPAIVLPFTWLRWQFQRAEERIRPLLGYGESFSTACAQVACLGTVAMVVVAMSRPVESFQGNGKVRFDKTVQSATVLPTGHSQALQAFLPSIAASAEPSVDSQPSVVETAGSLADGVINPSQNADPETTIFDSIAASPNYENDHTILASGYCGKCASRVVFASNDGGANWKPLPSRLFFGRTMVLSPGYSQDRRIFALGDLGLQQSDDGGGIFRTVSPLIGWGLAIAPSFGSGDSTMSGNSKILISSGKVIFEYDAETEITQPASLNLPLARGAYSSVTYSPGYLSDRTVFVSDEYTEDPVHYRCKRSICEETQFSIPGPLLLRLSPRFDQNGLAYAFTNSRLLASSDGGWTFRDLQFSLPDWNYIKDVAVLWNMSSDPTIFVSVYGLMPGVYRSFDGGRSWNKQLIDVPSFHYGSEKLIVTSNGRLLAATGAGGIACSKNGGQTWARRCPPE